MNIPTHATLNKNKVIMIICDGLRADTCFQEMGFLNSLIGNIGQRTISIADSPSVSRTNYETLHTGVPALIHGISSNLLTNKSNMNKNIFSELKKIGKTSAVVGSSWFYDLYGKDKYHYLKHKEINKEDNDIITWGRFFSDDCPDSVDESKEGLAHTFQLSDMLIHKYFPDYLLIHIITPDEIGHSKGIGKEYSVNANNIDGFLGLVVNRWLNMGYEIILTSDHGMDKNNNHGGSKCDEMLTPFYLISKKGWKIPEEKMYHIDIVPLILERLLPSKYYKEYIEYRKELMKDYKYPVTDCLL